ncbi:MAG: iron chelate uptake ABC transporter family permease subunit [Gammaproteobacteria bacterium]
MIELLLPALIIGLSVAAVSGPLGSFIVWRRMAYFGDALAHGALLGVAIGLLIDWPLALMTFVMCIALALILVIMEHRKRLSNDTLLGILAHSTLSLGLTLISLQGGRPVNLHAYLFGNLLTATLSQAIWLSITCAVVGVILTRVWRPMLNITIHEDIAHIEGTSVWITKLFLMTLVAVVIAIGMRVVGILLITSLLVIPAASARQHSRTPEQMAIRASLFGCGAVVPKQGLQSVLSLAEQGASS